MTHTVAVIIPTHNRRERLALAIASVLEQTRPADEIIVIDDGSSDDSSALVKNTYPMITLISQKNQGVSAARNTGINHALARGRGHDWIALLDDDDLWKPEKLAKQLSAINANPNHKICHTQEQWIRNNKPVNQPRKYQKKGGHIFNDCLPLCAIAPSAVLIHRDLFQEHGLFDTNLPACEDYDLWLRLCAQHPVLLVDEVLTIKHGGHPDQLSTTIWGLDRFRIQALKKILAQSILSPDQKKAAQAMLVEKQAILDKGAKKRQTRE
ncbi:MAG: glycosyltransferase family 2 protein [Methylococcaceae bacterium]